MTWDTTDVLAWLGASTGTLALIWDIVKWSRDGARLDLEVQPGMVRVGNETKGQVSRENVFISVSVANNGSQPTTIISLTTHHYIGLFSRLLRRPKKNALVQPMAMNGASAPIPQLLGPGERWAVLMEQKTMEAWDSEGGVVRCAVRHSASRKPLWGRVRMDKPE